MEKTVHIHLRKDKSVIEAFDAGHIAYGINLKRKDKAYDMVTIFIRDSITVDNIIKELEEVKQIIQKKGEEDGQ